MKSNFWNGFFIKLHCYIYLGAMRWLNFLAHSNIGGRIIINKRLGKKNESVYSPWISWYQIQNCR